MSRSALVVAVVIGTVGCHSYRGGARAIDPARLTNEPGWTVAASTPSVRQTGRLDCGAAALSMVAARWQMPWSLAAINAALPPPDPRGIRLDALRDAARDHQLMAFAIVGDRATLIHELTAGRPVIVGLLLPYGGRRAQSHYEVVVAVRVDTDEFVTLDPASGWRARTWAALDAEWRPAGYPTLVVLGPS